MHITLHKFSITYEPTLAQKTVVRHSVASFLTHAADVEEAVVLIMAMRSSNMPKFLVDDAALFTAIVADLFPGIQVPEHVSCFCFLPVSLGFTSSL